MLHGKLIGVCAEILKTWECYVRLAIDKVTAGLFKVPDSQNSGFLCDTRRQLTFSQFLQKERMRFDSRQGISDFLRHLVRFDFPI